MNNALDDRMNNRHNIPREAKPFHSTTSFRWSRKRAISFPATIWCLSKRMDNGRFVKIEICVDDLTMTLSRTSRSIAAQLLKQAKKKIRHFNPPYTKQT